MERSNWIIRVIGALVLVGLLVAGGYAVYQAGFAQGVHAELPQGATAPLDGNPYYGYPHFGFWPFFGFGIFFKILLFIFLFFIITRVFFFGMWAMAGGPRRHWRGGWHRNGWWHEDDEDEDEEEPKRRNLKTKK